MSGSSLLQMFSLKKKNLLSFRSNISHWKIITQKRLNSSANATTAIATIKNKNSLHIPMLNQQSK
jgi:hypothetical protein